MSKPTFEPVDPPEPGEELDHSGNVYPTDVPIDNEDAGDDDDDLTDEEG